MIRNCPYAPVYHVAPSRGWINDPNGMVYFNSEWHLFYQYYEPSMVDGMQWGHAVSTDLAHWKTLPPALAPDRHGQIWSGSSVVDQHDSSGLFGGKPGMVCLFTYWDKADHRQCQGMAYSADGRTFRMYDGNPVIPQLRHLPGHPDDKDFRDPKVFWHEPSKRWVMIVAGGRLRVFSSKDLAHWAFESVSETIDTECPDLFPMALDGDPRRSTWVLSLGGRAYLLGEFDGRSFTATSERITMSGGPDFYASQTFADAPLGRRIAVSWIHDWTYGNALSASGIRTPFPTGAQAGGCLTVPCELSLRSTAAGPRLFMQPVAELAGAFTVPPVVRELTLDASGATQLPDTLRSADIHITSAQPPTGRLTLSVPAAGANRVEFGWDCDRGVLFIDRRASGITGAGPYCSLYEAPLTSPGPIDLRVLIDSCSIELFAHGGATHMSAFVPVEPSAAGLQLSANVSMRCRVESRTAADV